MSKTGETGVDLALLFKNPSPLPASKILLSLFCPFLGKGFLYGCIASFPPISVLPSFSGHSCQGNLLLNVQFSCNGSTFLLSLIYPFLQGIRRSGLTLVRFAVLSIFFAHLYQPSRSVGGASRFMILLCNFTGRVSLKMSTMTADFLFNHDSDKRVANVIICLSISLSYFIWRVFISLRASPGES